MFTRNFDKLKTKFARQAVYRVKHHLKLLKIKCRFSELQWLSCRNNIVTAMQLHERWWSGGLLACTCMRSYAFNILNIPNFLRRLH